MGRLFWVVAVPLALPAGVSAGSIYLTTTEKIGVDSPYTFIAPYVTGVETRLSISVAKAAAPLSSTNSASTPGSESKGASPIIEHAGKLTQDKDGNWQIPYSVNCDLTSVLHPSSDGGDAIMISGAKPVLYNGYKDVTAVTTNTVTVSIGKTKPDVLPTGATITGTTCPSAAAATSVSLVGGVAAIPTSRAYLYLLKDAFFSDAINVTVDGNGMLSGSDSSSQQQITNILTEIGQTAGTVLSGGGLIKPLDEKPGEGTPPKPLTPRERCFNAIATLVKPGPYYDTVSLGDVRDTRRVTKNRDGWDWPVYTFESDSLVSLHFELAPIRTPGNLASFNTLTRADASGKHKHSYLWNYGLVAFFPVPARASLLCNVNLQDRNPPYRVYLNAPSIVNLYLESQFIDPQRDFLTGPQDTLTFNAGFITGHKYSDQSSAKTIVDTVTAPIRALVPSVSMTQSTTVTSTGSSTSTTSTTTGPPKGP